jgi:transcriptional regulator GlxA family with amidase domain
MIGAAIAPPESLDQDMSSMLVAKAIGSGAEPDRWPVTTRACEARRGRSDRSDQAGLDHPAPDWSELPLAVDPFSARLHVFILLLDGFDLVDLVAFTDTFETLNNVASASIFTVTLLGLSAGRVMSSSGISIHPHMCLRQAGHIDNLILLSGAMPEGAIDPALRQRLRALEARRRCIGAAGGGCLVLANAGLTTGRRVSVPWGAGAAQRLAEAGAQVNDHIFSIDRSLITGSGGRSTVDLALYCVARHCGRQMAWAVADHLNCDRIRDGRDLQRPARACDPPTTNPALRQATAIMRENLAHPLDSAKIAKRISVTRRQLQRLFQRHLGISPAQYYLACRLRHARELLRQSALTIADVAAATGFVSQSHFAQSYRRHYGVTPTADRRADWTGNLKTGVEDGSIAFPSAVKSSALPLR